jgi:single-strand DNA-binding protein
MNVVALIGRVVADPELRYTPSGLAVTTLRIAVDRRFKSQSGEKETDFFDVVAWRQSAEFAANYLTKGRLVGVQGSLQQRNWVQQDGQKRTKIEIVADALQGLDKPQGTQGGAAQSHEEQPPTEAPPGGGEADMDYDPFAEE